MSWGTLSFMMSVDTWALVVAVVALGASGLIGMKANSLNRRLVEIENTREKREEGASRSADLL